MKKALMIFISVLCFSFTMLGQGMSVKGVVLSEEDNEPIPGATVKVDGTPVVTVTDADGRFSLMAPRDAKELTVSYIGMTTRHAAIAPEMKVMLASDVQTLGEVVVTGYGSTRRAAFTGAASVVGPETIEKQADMNFVKSLEGAVTGFQRNTSTGMPGQWASVYIRGNGSLSSSSQPLYVVDGIPVNSSYEDMNGGDDNNAFDPMAAYNPADIESVTVLKDAAATAIYGSRASNGVIVITTKRGASGKFQLNFETKQGFTSIANNNMKYANAPETMDLFTQGYMRRFGVDDYDAAYEFMCNYFGWDGVANYDWMKAVTRSAYFQEYNLSFSGTTGSTNYYASMNYADNDGVVINSGNKRYSGRLNLDTSFKWFNGGVNASYAYSKNSSFSQSTSGSYSNPMVGAIANMLPFDPLYTDDGTEYANVDAYNPLAVNDPKLGDLNDVVNQTINANPWLKVNLPYGIWLKTNFGANIVDQQQYQYWSAVYNPQGMDYNGLGQQYNSRKSTLTWTNTLGWDYTFNKQHDVNLLLGQEMQRYEMWFAYLCGYDLPFASDGMRDLATAGAWMDSQYYREQSRLASYFMDAHYSFADRYYLSASLRRDGSSVFGSNKRWGTFWSVGGKWRMSQEKFLQYNNVITNAALRISYGTVGNQSLPSLYAARGYYLAGYNYNGSPGMRPGNVSNPDLSWETSRKFDVGFDLSFISRLHMTFDFYNEDTSDALYYVPVSMTTGIAGVYKNIGKMRNSGIELGINGTVFTNRDVTVNAFANLSWNKNKVIKLADGSVEGSIQIIEEGRPYRQFYMKEYAGFDPETGTPLYYLNAEGDELTDDYTAAAKRYVGSAEPKVFGAFGVSAQSHGFDFSMQFNYRLGSKVYNSGARFTGFGMNFMTPLKDVVDNSWTETNHNAKYPAYIYGDPYYATQNSSRFLMSGNYLRLSNISLGYTLPRALTRKAAMEKVRIYTTFDNVHTWTASNFTGYTPDTYASGIISFQYPAVFTFTAGLQVTF